MVTKTVIKLIGYIDDDPLPIDSFEVDRTAKSGVRAICRRDMWVFHVDTTFFDRISVRISVRSRDEVHVYEKNLDEIFMAALENGEIDDV